MWGIGALIAALLALGRSGSSRSGSSPRKSAPGATPRWTWPLRLLADGRAPVISQRFGPRPKGKGVHLGVDVTFEAAPGDPPYEGHYTAQRTPRYYSPADAAVFPVLPGVVTLTAAVGSSNIRGQVYVLHDDGTMTRYAHLSAVAVAKGDHVGLDTPLGVMGAGAGTPFMHLHLEWFNKRVKLGGRQLNPADKLALAVAHA